MDGRSESNNFFTSFNSSRNFNPKVEGETCDSTPTTPTLLHSSSNSIDANLLKPINNAHLKVPSSPSTNSTSSEYSSDEDSQESSPQFLPSSSLSEPSSFKLSEESKDEFNIQTWLDELLAVALKQLSEGNNINTSLDSLKDKEKEGLISKIKKALDNSSNQLSRNEIKNECEVFYSSFLEECSVFNLDLKKYAPKDIVVDSAIHTLEEAADIISWLPKKEAEVKNNNNSQQLPKKTIMHFPHDFPKSILDILNNSAVTDKFDRQNFKHVKTESEKLIRAEDDVFMPICYGHDSKQRLISGEKLKNTLKRYLEKGKDVFIFMPRSNNEEGAEKFFNWIKDNLNVIAQMSKKFPESKVKILSRAGLISHPNHKLACDIVKNLFIQAMSTQSTRDNSAKLKSFLIKDVFGYVNRVYVQPAVDKEKDKKEKQNQANNENKHGQVEKRQNINPTQVRNKSECQQQQRNTLEKTQISSIFNLFKRKGSADNFSQNLLIALDSVALSLVKNRQYDELAGVLIALAKKLEEFSTIENKSSSDEHSP